MAVARSPNYPQIDLEAALELMRAAYKAEGRNKMSRAVLASHFGYSSLNGRALAKIGAVRAYGLIDGREDDLRITSDAIHCLEAPEGSAERAEALARCALRPTVFKEIASEYPSLPSEQNLRFHLIKKTYTAEAAGKAAQNYLNTMRLVVESGGGFDSLQSVPPQDEASPMPQSAIPRPTLAQAASATGAVGPISVSQMQNLPGPGTQQAVFPLAEGNVYLTFPSELTSDGYAELAEYLGIFLRRAGRAKRLEEAQDEFSDLA
ncbi:hypothetical protein HNP32_002161 [Brevundimonas bullata]|uniref:Uncharacterized protein n=1 Tax=Brevundimonas bullata TaxID=13160 RepID=A0A7W7IQK7_9CAUL|nr:hypothetical protein [Brevundimonas bullata]MBB4798417.1 hypothetical protein [Brevundimonas bullata]MBB6383269.1 hypothetical protein [Brevundimonas bullata]